MGGMVYIADSLRLDFLIWREIQRGSEYLLPNPFYLYPVFSISTLLISLRLETV